MHTLFPLMKRLLFTLMLVIAAWTAVPAAHALTPGTEHSGAPEVDAALDGQAVEDEAESGKINPKEIIFDHLMDRYGWEVPFNHHKSIPFPLLCLTRRAISTSSFPQRWSMTQPTPQVAPHSA